MDWKYVSSSNGICSIWYRPAVAVLAWNTLVVPMEYFSLESTLEGWWAYLKEYAKSYWIGF
jgi:hypothetical protein